MMDLCNVFVCRAAASYICFFVCLTLLRCDQIVCRSELSHITLMGLLFLDVWCFEVLYSCPENVTCAAASV